MLGSPERTEFGTVIRRSGTICLPTSNQLSETELNSLAEFVSISSGDSGPWLLASVLILVFMSISDIETYSLRDGLNFQFMQMGYKKMCQQEKQYKTGEVSKIERRHSSVEQIVQVQFNPVCRLVV